MKRKFDYGYYCSPIGWIKIIASEQLVSLSFVEEVTKEQLTFNSVVVSSCIEQLDHYFKNKSQSFNLPLTIKGTIFQELVWSETFKIPYGQTISYQELAQRIKKPKSFRAVGSALKKNPLAIIIPCHRVVRKDKSKIVNYFWGKERKIFLQQLETKK